MDVVNYFSKTNLTFIRSITSIGEVRADFSAINFSHFSSSEPKALWRVYSIHMLRRPSVRLPFTFSKVFSSKTTRPIKAKFYVEPPWVGGTKVCWPHLGHMAKMAGTPIY